MMVKDEAICIRAVDYSETSQIVTFFTRATGKITAIAKGSKRPKSTFDGPIEIFSYGKIVFSDSTRDKLATLTEFQQAPAFGLLTANLFVLHCASFAAELVNLLTHDYDPHPELFDDFLQLLKNTQDMSCEQRATICLLILFQLALLKHIGLQPILDACANCKTRYAIRGTSHEPTWPEIYFSSSANGLICRDCQTSYPDRIQLTKQAANCLSNVQPITDANDKTLNEIEKVLIHHFTETIGHPPKMAKYILTGPMSR